MYPAAGASVRNLIETELLPRVKDTIIDHGIGTERGTAPNEAIMKIGESQLRGPHHVTCFSVRACVGA